jgi:hypothetical protein
LGRKTTVHPLSHIDPGWRLPMAQPHRIRRMPGNTRVGSSGRRRTTPLARRLTGRLPPDGTCGRNPTSGRHLPLRNGVIGCIYVVRKLLRLFICGPLGDPDLGFAVRVAVVNEDRRGPCQHIVRVLRGPALSAYSQISGGFGFRWRPWLCGGIRGCCRRYCRQGRGGARWRCRWRSVSAGGLYCHAPGSARSMTRTVCS